VIAQDQRRAAGCHLCLTVPLLPNPGLTADGRKVAAWSYAEPASINPAANQTAILEALSAREP
jgi:hypothetical protein